MGNYVYKDEDIILIGSAVFFSGFPDYNPKDYDYMIFCDKEKSTDVNEILRIFNKNNKIERSFTTYNTKEQFIKRLKEHNNPSTVFGGFLCPKFCEKINFTLDDLKSLKYYVDNLDDKHKYQQVIYDAYIENNSFTLTEEQLNHAYQVYKDARKNIYSNA